MTAPEPSSLPIGWIIVGVSHGVDGHTMWYGQGPAGEHTVERREYDEAKKDIWQHVMKQHYTCDSCNPDVGRDPR
jgi:hypothetical protein